MHIIETLDTLLKDELSATETYQQARRLSENTILKRVTPDGYQKIFKLF